MDCDFHVYLQFLQRYAQPAGCCYNEALNTFFGNRLVQKKLYSMYIRNTESYSMINYKVRN